MDKVRAEFERDTSEWSSNYAEKDEDGKYLDQSVQNAWLAWLRVWQAATEAARGGEPVAWSLKFPVDHRRGTVNAMTTFTTKKTAEEYAGRCGDEVVTVTPLYTQPPAPVVPDGWTVERRGDMHLIRKFKEGEFVEGKWVEHDGLGVLSDLLDDMESAQESKP